MPLLSEYALTPDVFDSTSYSSDEVGSIQLQYLKEVLLNEGLVRDLRDGAWRSLFANNVRPWHRRGKELLKKLIVQRRLHRFPAMLPSVPSTDRDWCQEALASHGRMPLMGIVTTRNVAASFRDPVIAPIDRLSSAPWWVSRSSSVRLLRTINEYEENLYLILRCANSIMFVDPHLDPSRPHYQDFISLLNVMAGRSPAPLIEIHRVCYYASGRDREFIDQPEWQRWFNTAWAIDLQSANLSVEVFIWDDFHDRYLISDLVGIGMQNGFDTTIDTNSITTWTRLGRKDRDDVQREFDPASNRHTLLYRFVVPLT
jgi:hypothetical protein